MVLNEHTMVSGYRLLCELCLSGMLWDTVNGLSMSIKWWLRLYFCLLQEYNIKAILNIACKRERGNGLVITDQKSSTVIILTLSRPSYCYKGVIWPFLQYDCIEKAGPILGFEQNTVPADPGKNN